MKFVNEIAEVVHSSVDSMTGATNKNIGEAFLFVWKYPSSVMNEKHNDIIPGLVVE